MNKMLAILVFGLMLISCGKKVSSEPKSMGIVDSLTSQKGFSSSKLIDEKTCIDDELLKDLGENEIVKKVIDNSDISFCNGLRVRLKILKMSSGDLRVYGFASSSSGKMSCLKQGTDFQRFPLLGDQGTLVGDKIKISLGGHEYDSENKLIKSKRFKGKFVKFDMTDYSGEMGFFEGNKLKCWAQH